MFVKPAEGRVVRDPHSMALLPEEGREVSDTDLYWVRRVRDGDVEVVDTGHQPAAQHAAQHHRAQREA